jgi:hypothetical protein
MKFAGERRADALSEGDALAVSSQPVSPEATSAILLVAGISGHQLSFPKWTIPQSLFSRGNGQESEKKRQQAAGTTTLAEHPD